MEESVITFDERMVKLGGPNWQRPPLSECTEQEFLKSLVQLLLKRGQEKLVPPGGLKAFPGRSVNGSKLDLFNLYKQVVSRGGFGNGVGSQRRINWSRDVFPHMNNYTDTHKMTSIGHDLINHYKTFLAEYEVDHAEDITCSTEYRLQHMPPVDSKIEVFWPGDGMWYAGTIEAYHPSTNMHRVEYDDGDTELLDLNKEVFRLEGDPQGRIGPPLDSVEGHKPNRAAGNKRKRNANDLAGAHKSAQAGGKKNGDSLVKKVKKIKCINKKADIDLAIREFGLHEQSALVETAAEVLQDLAAMPIQPQCLLCQCPSEQESSPQLRDWLEANGWGKYLPLFELNEVDEDVLPMLEEVDLKDMPIKAVGVRRHMLVLIEELRSHIAGDTDEMKETKGATRDNAAQPHEDGLAVRDWLISNGFDAYATTFATNEVTMAVLPMLTLGDLEELRVDPTHAAKMMDLVHQS
ncbi:hypothetical protein CYMTET_51485 [Cymbomonas tetramitiformis]|uniref:SAM domain-containing protein n=1 Tax=Cymbomonas tetramitiformis TaxID=36881 RepID=A0AAE0ESL3_9CHLO|nr:hypothetical protein CYMTET_51485 [Cymbomonas tetramitiformis]